MEEKKTEEQLRHDIRREFSLSENNPKEKAVIDGILKEKKDRYTATQQKKKALESLGAKSPEGEEDPKRETNDSLSVKDAALLQQNNVSVEDWDEVVDYAKYKKISIGEALKSSVIQTSLRERKEERQSSDVINTGRKRGGDSKIDGNALLKKANEKYSSEEMSDDEMDALVEAREASKRRK